MTRYPALALFSILAAGTALAQQPVWQEIAPMSVGRSEMRAVVIDGKFYVAGGFNTSGAQLNSLEAYDPGNNTWTSLANMPIGMDHHMMAAHGGKLYVLKYASIHIYDPVANAWTSRTDNSGMSRSDGTAVTFGDHIYVIGGGPLSVQRYNPATDQWETRASLQTSRGHVNAVVLDGRIWILGGRSGNTAFRSVEIYDPVANTMVPGPPMDSVRSGHAAEVVNGKIVVVGGEVPNPTRLARTAEVYDPAAGSWSFLPEPTLVVHGMASASWNGRIYLLGGATVAYSATNTNRSFYLEIPASTSVRPAYFAPRAREARQALWDAHGTPAFPWKSGAVRADGKILRLSTP
jgi:N-acetylneuraminic acid mutarotase